MSTKILIVDDEKELQELIKARFKRAIDAKEFNFYFALNGQEALDMLMQDPELSIIFTDINMPVMDGLTLLARLPEIDRLYKAVVISAYGDMSNIRRAMNLGASDFILKPFDFADLEHTLRKVVDEYNLAIEAKKTEKSYHELQVELEIAKAIQGSMLPVDFHPMPDASIEIAAKMIPAEMVGGDFFDFFPIDNEKLAMVIADVSGKGISACLYMATTKALFRAMATFSCDDTLRKINAVLSRENPSCMFVTAFYGILNTTTGVLSYCNAGHPPPLLLSKDGSFATVAQHDTALGLAETEAPVTMQYHNAAISLKQGDTLFFYTDGITEALNAEDQFFTTQRLIEALEPIINLPVDKIIEKISATLSTFTVGTHPSDDITMMALRWNAPNKK